MGVFAILTVESSCDLKGEEKDGVKVGDFYALRGVVASRFYIFIRPMQQKERCDGCGRAYQWKLRVCHRGKTIPARDEVETEPIASLHQTRLHLRLEKGSSCH